MAENEQTGAAQNKLGELFVDFGTKGLGDLLGGLNKVSAQFLLTKNSAEQFIKPIVGMSRRASDYVINLDKINAVTGISLEKLQDLQLWAKQSNVDFESFVNSLGSLQQNLLKIKMGMPGADVSGYSLLGIDPRTLNYEQPLDILDKIKNRVGKLPQPVAAMGLQQIGLSPDLLYAFEQMNKSGYSFKNNIMSPQELERLRKQNQALNAFQNTWDTFTRRTISDPNLTNLLIKGGNYVMGLPTDPKAAASKVGGDIVKGAAKGTANTINPFALQNLPKALGNWIGGEITKGTKNFINQKTGKSTGFAAPIATPTPATIDLMSAATPTPATIDLMSAATPTPASIQNSTITKTNNISINNTITGENANDIAISVSDRVQQDLNTLESLNTIEV